MLSLLIFLSSLTVAGCATQSMTADGLVSTPSGAVDELYLRPNTKITEYSRVVIEPVPVKFRNDYPNQHGLNSLLAQQFDRPYQDPQEIAQDYAALMQASLARAFRKANYEVVSSGGPGVLRVAARIDQLYINAPDRMSSMTRASFNRDTGQADLSMEAIDASTGTVLARVVHRYILREPTRFNLASDTSNRFWFETAFDRWSASVIGELGEARRSQISQVR